MLKLLLKHKKLIIIFMVIVGLLIFIKEKGFKKLTEKFENANLVDVLNGLDVQDQKLNDMIKETSVDTVTFNKNLNTNKNIKASGRVTVGNKVTLYPNGAIVGEKLKIGGSVLDKTDIKKMKALKNIAGYAINGDGTTHLLFEGYHKLRGNNKFNGWSNNKWDIVYLFRGWKIQIWQNDNKTNVMENVENKNEDVKKVDIDNDRASEYEVIWVDY